MFRITSFQQLGIKYIALKPGSTESLSQVVAIARAHPTFNLICQWTGGRAGGHHSFEDFHSPILSMYSTLRRCSNIILIAGSGFGGADDTEPYLTGEWALKFAHPPMPFDGVLFGSRVMTALEARTSVAVCPFRVCDLTVCRQNKLLLMHLDLMMKIGRRLIRDLLEELSQSVLNSVNQFTNSLLEESFSGANSTTLYSIFPKRKQQHSSNKRKPTSSNVSMPISKNPSSERTQKANLSIWKI